VYDDEIATLATDDADLPIGRLTVSAAPFEVLPRLSSAAMDALRRDYALSRVRAAEVPATGDEIGRSRPVGGTSAGIFTGRVLRDGSATCTPATCSVPVWGSAYDTTS